MKMYYNWHEIPEDEREYVVSKEYGICEDTLQKGVVYYVDYYVDDTQPLFKPFPESGNILPQRGKDLPASGNKLPEHDE